METMNHIFKVIGWMTVIILILMGLSEIWDWMELAAKVFFVGLAAWIGAMFIVSIIPTEDK